MTKTPKTQKEYMVRANSLLDRYAREMGIGWSDNPEAFCQWFGAMRQEWRPATWRQYKAAICFFMEQFGPQEVLDYILSLTQELCAKESANPRTSAQKQKHLQNKELEILTTELSLKKGDYDHLLAIWLIVNRFVGLRPSEWETAYLAGDNLVVKNGKATNGRSHGATRTLCLEDAPKQINELIHEFIFLLHKTVQEKGSFDFVYARIRLRLHSLTRKLWPRKKKWPTLYSTRHQFSADLKKNNYSLPEIAALFGHATDETATTHYGKRKKGEKGSSFVKPDQKEVGRVRKTFTNGSTPVPSQTPQEDSPFSPSPK